MKEMMVLNIGDDKSEFYGFEKYKSDSTLNADSKKGIYSIPPRKKINSNGVIRNINS